MINFRDGAPIEMTGLLKHCLDFVVKYHGLKMFPYDGVIKKNGKTLLYSDWVSSIKNIIIECFIGVCTLYWL